MPTLTTPNSDLDRYSIDAILIGFGERKTWRCRVYFDNEEIGYFEVKGGSHEQACTKAKERAVAIASRYLDTKTGRPD